MNARSPAVTLKPEPGELTLTAPAAGAGLVTVAPTIAASAAVKSSKSSSAGLRPLRVIPRWMAWSPPRLDPMGEMVLTSHVEGLQDGAAGAIRLDPALDVQEM